MLKENINKINRNDEVKGELEPSYLRPFVLVEDVESYVYKLSSMDVKEEIKTLNIIHLKCFYA